MAPDADALTWMQRFTPSFDVFAGNPMVACECGWSWDAVENADTLADAVTACAQHAEEDHHDNPRGQVLAPDQIAVDREDLQEAIRIIRGVESELLSTTVLEQWERALRGQNDPTPATTASPVHLAWLCRCHRELWAPLCDPSKHWTVPLIGSGDEQNYVLVTCPACRGDMEKRGFFDAR